MFNRLKMRKKKINPRECKSYGKGEYCCGRLYSKCKDKCNTFSHCVNRLRCHVKIGSDTRCINFEPTKHNIR